MSQLIANLITSLGYSENKFDHGACIMMYNWNELPNKPIHRTFEASNSLHVRSLTSSLHTDLFYTVWYWLSVMTEMMLQQWGTNRRRDSAGWHCKHTKTCKRYPNMQKHTQLDTRSCRKKRMQAKKINSFLNTILFKTLSLLN